MSDAELDPHVLISAKIGGAQKILALPSHRSRWGWVVMLGHAKLHRPPGRFDSLQQVRYLVGEFRDCVPAWIDAGLLHVVPNLCRCLSQVDDAKVDELVVHDWKAHQERRSRTTAWRDEKGIPSGHVNLSAVSPDVSPSVSPVVSPPPVYADAHGRQSQSLSEPPSSEGVQGEPNAWDAFNARTGEIPGVKLRGWLNDLCDAHSEERVVAMIGRLPKTHGSSVDYLKAVRDALRAEDFEAEKAERSAEKASVAQKRRPIPVPQPARDMTEAEAKAAAKAYIASTKAVPA